MTVHEKPVGASVEWYTPKSLFDRLGLEFDLDPASPCPAVPWIPTSYHYCIDGERLPWEGRVWLNPPYGPAAVPFVERMIQHRDGLLLLPARTETRIFQRAAISADLVVFLRDRLHFVRPNGIASRASFGSVLLVWGNWQTIEQVLAANLGWGVDNTAAAKADALAPELRPQQTFHYEREPLLDGTTVRWPVLD